MRNPDDIRRDLQRAINDGDIPPEGQTWSPKQIQEDFEILGFMAPIVVVRRKADGARGTLMFRHQPRVYFAFQPEEVTI